MALVWLRIRDATSLPQTTQAEVPAWFKRVALGVMPPYEDTSSKSRTVPRNNHSAWAGLAVAAAGVAANDHDLLDWGIRRYRLTISQIQEDGTLPLELARARRALHYHLFAAGPVVVLAELAAANGLDLYGAASGAVHRYLARALDGREDSRWF